jgi:hypothetical protein
MKMTFLLWPCLFVPAMLHADSFGSGAFEYDFVEIGNPGNLDDDTGYGGVNYAYRMGVTEVSRGMITAYNDAADGGPNISLFNMSAYGGNGVNRPATGVSWNEAARFVNWLNTSSNSSAAYKFETGGANDNIALWQPGDAGYNAVNPFRNSNAKYFLPSEDEWYKAAYYDPSRSAYLSFATGSGWAPTAVASGTTRGTAVYRQSLNTGPADITDAGGLSPYGTMGQSGNLAEWSESGFTAPNDSAVEDRVIRGGLWHSSARSISVFNRANISPTAVTISLGFRVAAVPEPSAAILALLGLMGVVVRRRR